MFLFMFESNDVLMRWRNVCFVVFFVFRIWFIVLLMIRFKSIGLVLLLVM